MASFNIITGKDIKLRGAARKEYIDVLSPKTVAIQPPDFRGLKPRVLVKEGDSVKRGSVIMEDKAIDGLKLLSPVAGKVKAVNRGAKRALMSVVVENNKSTDAENFKKYDASGISGLKRDEIIQNLLAGGLWPCVRQRPFAKVASPSDMPKVIFVRATNTDPLAADADFILNDQEQDFQNGLDIISKLTDGKTHVCVKNTANSAALTSAKGVEVHLFSGPHPAGNIGTLIHKVDPINKGDIVWYIEAQDVIRIAQLFSTGQYPNRCVVALTGEGVKDNVYAFAITGTSFKDLLSGSKLDGNRCITGSVLSGRDVGQEGFLGFYDSQITVIPEGGTREILGWLVPGFKKYTLSHTYASAFLPEKEVSLDTDENGGHRAIVLNHVYDSYVALDVVTFFLLKAIIAEDIDEAERLGILECDEEDFALCTFACPSKTDVGAIIRRGLDIIEKEG